MSTTSPAENSSAQRMEFKTEVRQLLDLVIHSLYTKKEIFLRELISNAADAIDKVRFEALTNPALTDGDAAYQIKLIANETDNTLTIRDNGIGMSRETIVDHLGTIAKSGTKAFVENLKKQQAQNAPELIGQFGVGFYASFMVADRVTVLSRQAGTPVSDGVKWVSEGQGDFTVEPFEKPTRGTEVVLHLREDARDFLKTYRLKEVVKAYSDFIDHPIVLDVEKDVDGKKTTVEETVNSRQALWLRPKHEIKQEEYNAFYKSISRDFEDPSRTIHIAAEGATEFRAVLFFPANKPMEWMMGPPPKSQIDLYVKRVLITHQCEQVIPEYLRFVRGVVDSSDLPLNVSRETLQHNPILARIKSNLTNRVLKTLEDMKAGEFDAYVTFFKEFGWLLKEGVGIDFANRDRLSDLLIFESTSTKSGEFTSLQQYVERMKVEQKEIHYIIGDSRQQVENSPYLESIKASGEEVLLLTEPIDEFVINQLNTYKDKPLKAADRAKGESDVDAGTKEKFKPLTEALKSKLDSDVKEVRLSQRLKESAACLVSDEYAMSAHMERLMQRMGRGGEVGETKRILELNPDHAVVQKLLDLQQADANNSKIETIAKLLFDQATIAEGGKVKDPAGFGKRMNELLTLVG